MLDTADRRRLRAALHAAEPWLEAPDLGPRAVIAGPCDRCDDEPRLVEPCGPVAWRALGRRCLLALGHEAFCPGHADVADDLLARARDLPDIWDTLVRLAWVASGEVAGDRAFLAHAAATLRDLGMAGIVSAPPSPGSVG